MTESTSEALRPSVPSGALELRSVSKAYGQGASARMVVEDCTLRVEPGTFAVMIGPSGAGKSTLVRLVAGFEAPTRGEVLVDGRRVAGPGPDRQVMFQETALFPWLTTADNVYFGPRARGDWGVEVRRLGEGLMSKVGLLGFRAKYPKQLSGGMQRRAELARAMINRPSVMILDEPFRGLDAMTKKLMIEQYAAHFCDAPRTNLFVTTDVDEALFLADRLFVMAHLPTRVRAVVDRERPRPRCVNERTDDEEERARKAYVLALLHEEARRSFAPASAVREGGATRVS